MGLLDVQFKSAFTVDNVIFGFDEGDLKILLIKRGEEPFAGHWGLPGYFVKEQEDVKEAAERVLKELTSLTDVYLEQVGTFGHPRRHPMGRVITVSYYSLIKISDYFVKPDSIALNAVWYPVRLCPALAFDHSEIVKAALDRLKTVVRLRPVGFELLPKKFTLTELQHLYEAILDDRLDKRNFRKKIMAMDFVRDLDETQEGVAHRPARLYSFDASRYRHLVDSGFVFEI